MAHRNATPILKMLSEAFMADFEVFDLEQEQLVRMSDYLESRAHVGQRGLELDTGEYRAAVALPSRSQKEEVEFASM